MPIVKVKFLFDSIWPNGFKFDYASILARLFLLNKFLDQISSKWSKITRGLRLNSESFIVHQICLILDGSRHTFLVQSKDGELVSIELSEVVIELILGLEF
ncbi:MAG: hypothetical protein ACFFCW_43345 [Candidatus Hodarchaeota archaeon]